MHLYRYTKIDEHVYPNYTIVDAYNFTDQKWFSKIDSIRDDIIGLLDKKKENSEFYNDINIENILNILDKFHETFTETTNNIKTHGGLYFSDDFFCIKYWEGDYGSIGLSIYANDYDKVTAFLKKQFYGNLGHDEINIFLLPCGRLIQDVVKFECIVFPYMHLFIKPETIRDSIGYIADMSKTTCLKKIKFDI